MTPLAFAAAEEEDPEAAFAAALPGASKFDEMPKFEMPKSPSFGDADFGGFSAGLGGSLGGGDGGGDAWGGKAGWGGAADMGGGGDFSVNSAVSREEVGDDDGWGRTGVEQSAERRVQVGSEPSWEHAQERIRLQQQLVVR